MPVKYVLWDLDGTLTDPGLGITNSVMHALEKAGEAIPPREELYKFIGPPLIWSFMNFCSFIEEKARQAVADYREYFTDRGIFENEVYPAIPAALKELREAGYTLAMATSKPEDFARRIAVHFGFFDDFALITGSLMDETRLSKGEVIATVLEKLQVPASDCVMIGDREHDVIGAKQHSMRVIGVLYGYGSREELEAAGADYLVATPEEAVELIRSGKLG